MEFILGLFIVGFIIWLCVWEPAAYAHRRGASFAGWFIVGLFIPFWVWGPVLVLYSGKPILKPN